VIVKGGNYFDKNVFRFQIPVNDAAFVQVTNPRDELLHYLNNVRFSNLVILQELEKFAAVNLLHHDEHPAFSLVHFSHFNYVWVAKKTDNLDFIAQKFLFALVQLRFVYFFQRVRYLSAFVFCFENLRELSTSETCGLSVKVVDTVELTVVLQLSNPIVNNSLFFVEQTPLSKVFIVSVQS